MAITTLPDSTLVHRANLNIASAIMAKSGPRVPDSLIGRAIDEIRASHPVAELAGSGAMPMVVSAVETFLARVTKLPLETLQAMAKDTPVFEPGLDNMVAPGAVHAVLDPDSPLGPHVEALIGRTEQGDIRDRLGLERGGRPVAQTIAARVVQAAGGG